MAESSAVFHKSDVQRLLEAFKNGKIEKIEPELVYDRGVRYPGIEEIMNVNHKTLLKSLEELTNIDVLSSEIRYNLATCPKCGSHKLIVRVGCPVCGSSNLVKRPVIEHLTCGHLDAEEKFRKGGSLVCPRCSQELRLIGVDFRRLGILFVCESCRQRFPDAKHFCRCDSGHEFDQKDQSLWSVRAYKFNSEKRALIERATLDLKPLIDQFVVEGWTVKAPLSISVRPGVEHQFAFGIWQGDLSKDRPCILAELSMSTAESDSAAVLAFYAKALDFVASDKVLIVMPRLNAEARSLARIYQIQVVEADNAAELKKNLEHLLKTLLEYINKKATEVGLLDFVWAQEVVE